jgi:hypothetical protein
VAWTYGGDPDSNARDAIRFLIGDTDTNDQILNDEEVAWVNKEVTGDKTATTGLYTAAYRCCITIASKYSRLADQAVGDLRVDLSQKAVAYRDQASELEILVEREGGVPTPYAGAITISDKNVDEANSDINHGWFESGQFTDRRGGGSGRVLRRFGADT